MGANCIDDEAGVITVFADTALYTKEAVFKCLYWYGGRCQTSVSLLSDSTYQICLKPIPADKYTSIELAAFLGQFERDMIDFNLRDMVSRETRNVRDLLIAKAFSNGEFDELPPGELTDPVGFDITHIADD